MGNVIKLIVNKPNRVDLVKTNRLFPLQGKVHFGVKFHFARKKRKTACLPAGARLFTMFWDNPPAR